jgi:hypothetical protein
VAHHVLGRGRLPARIYAVETTSEQQTLLRAIGPADTVGLDSVAAIRVAPGGKSYAYVYIRSLYVLHQVTGLQ